MLLLDVLARLPTSLLVSSLVLAASALPVESVELMVLTPDNFDSTVAEGAWFIEHYSPYCTHCRAFASTWEKLVQHYESMEDPGVHLAQVNCAATGDLCNKHGVKGYPQMSMYKNGEMAEQFKGARDWDLLTAFVDEHAIHSPAKQKALPEPPTIQAPSQVQVESQKPIPNPEGMVKALDPSGFKAYLDDGPLFVKYYAPWCGHCKKLAPTWTQLAGQFRHKLNIVEVNCEVYKDLCKQEGVQGFPTLMYYSGGSDASVHKKEYTGGRKFDQLKKFADLAIAPSVTEVVSEAPYEHYVKENPVLYLFLHSPSDEQALNQLKQASSVLLGSRRILTSSNPDLRRRFSLPGSYASAPILLAIKDSVPHAYTSFFPFLPSSSRASLSVAAEKEEKRRLEEWLVHNRLPSALELTQDTFQEVMSAPHHPLVVIAAYSPSRPTLQIPADKVTAAAWGWRRISDGGEHEESSKSASARDVVFTWMDAEKWASWMKGMYGIKNIEEPVVVIADHHKLIYYDTNAKGEKITLDSRSLTDAVKDVLAGKVAYKNSENFIERSARRLNDFLVYLEEAVVAHPYRSALSFIGFVLVFIWVIKRVVSEDSTSYADYTRLQKDANRLD